MLLWLRLILGWMINLKEEAVKIFNELGLDLTTGIKIYLTKVVKEQGIPFEMTVKNDDLAQSIKEMENGEYQTFFTKEELMRDLLDEN